MRRHIKLRFYSHAQLPTGYGRAALDLALALNRVGASIEMITIGPKPTDTPWPIPDTLLYPIDNPDVIIVHTLPGDCHRVLELEGLCRGMGPKIVAYTTWEALTAPPELVRMLFERFDQVWVPSQPTFQAFGSKNPEGCESRLRVAPHCYDEDDHLIAPEYSSTGKFRFYWIGAWTARKNPAGLIRAFTLAFGPALGPDSNAELVLHSPGTPMDAFVHALASTGLEQRDLPSITLSNNHVNSLAKLHAESDCFVTASRGEAWNLPAFDALLAGRMVIAQYGLGSDDFLLDTTADLVDGLESPAHVDISLTHSDGGSVSMKRLGAQGLTSRCLWLEPNLSSLADSMRHVAAERKRDIRVSYDIPGRFGFEAVGTHVMNLLEDLL